MKIILSLITVLVLFQAVHAQNTIEGYEYWFNNNFDERVVNPTGSTPELNLNINIPAVGLTDGIHSFNIRFRDDNGLYSTVISRFFYRISPQPLSEGNEIISYEYWFNNDHTKAVFQAVSGQSQLTITAPVSAADLHDGIHVFNIRFRDKRGIWSSPGSSFFYKIPENIISGNRIITEYEYWFNNDHVNAVVQTAGDQQNLNLNTLISAGSLQPGIHTLNIRFKDETGLWCSPLSQFFYKMNLQSLTDNKITSYRYWINDDFNNVKNIDLVEPIQSYNLISEIDFTKIPKGYHTLHFQFMDATGMWSTVTTDSVKKVALPIADFVAENTVFCDSGIVQFNNLSMDADTFVWDFGDGHISSEPLPEHTYSSPGIYAVSLKVIDSETMKDSAISRPQFVHIYNHAVADFSFTTSHLEVSFVNKSLHSDSYLWNYGNNITSTDFSPTYTYFEKGLYNAKLVVFNQCSSDTAQSVIDLSLLSAENLSSGSNLVLFPKPASEQLWVRVKDLNQKSLKYSIRDIQGKILVQEQLENIDHTIQPIEIGFLTPGIYLIRFEGDYGWEYSERIIISR